MLDLPKSSDYTRGQLVTYASQESVVLATTTRRVLVRTPDGRIRSVRPYRLATRR